MTTPNLRERVARAIEESLYGTERIGRTDTLQYGLEADAAIAIVLEEAARVADKWEDAWHRQWREGWKCSDHLEGMSDAACEIAAAIRELKEKKNG